MGSQQEVSLVAHASNPTSLPEIRHFWSQVVGAGRANEGLRADWQQHLKIVARECGFRYVRFHGLYHDDMHVYNEVNGEIIYNFQYIDALIDALLDAGVRPFVEFGFCPSKLASQLDTVRIQEGDDILLAKSRGRFFGGVPTGVHPKIWCDGASLFMPQFYIG